MNYRTDTIEGIASVVDTIVIGRFIQVESGIENNGGYKSLITRGILVPTVVLAGDVQEQYSVSMAGGTVPYTEIANLYSAEELAKYEIDPYSDKYETLSETFENMTVFEEGKDYLVTLSLGEDGRYYLSPSLYSLCELSETKLASKVPASGDSPTSVSFDVDAYVGAFKEANQSKN